MGILIVGGLFGYAAMYIAGAYIRKQYRRKFCGKFEHAGTVRQQNRKDFLLFLNKHLGMVSPYFHKCGYLNQRGGILTAIDKFIAESADKITLCCEFVTKKKHFDTSWIRPELNGL